MAKIRNLILILGDQLTPKISSLKNADPMQDVILMAELPEEASYVQHHKKKIAFLFSAMRHFADELRQSGWTVLYITLDSPDNQGDFTAQTQKAIQHFKPQNIIVTDAGEWRLSQMFKNWQNILKINIHIAPDTRFLCTEKEFENWAHGRKILRMEYFYRDMRRKTGLLMDDDKPVGGKWNFDTENRKPADNNLFMPQPKKFAPDATTQNILDLVSTRFDNNFGDIEPFTFAVTRDDARRAFDHFVQNALPNFGDYQDAMLEGEPFLYHSVIAQYLNCGLLDPLEICRKVEAAYHAGTVPINAAEGYIRQIIGWREYIRAIYWFKMPQYENENFFNHHRPLPNFYWTGETDMSCVKDAIAQTKRHAYAHHIQRLMVTGNFAMLAGVNPHELHLWYLSVYADAYEWVEMPNTIGMSQFADGGLLASKPYAASGAYINRMSNYCKNCAYNVKKRTGKDACPFNALYWDFMSRHADKLKTNPRIGQMLRTYEKFSEEEKQAIKISSENFLKKLS
ncbi:cryptochrome/photolyase family protein [Sphingorhabdus lutea]|uniref:Cryptochrome/photolyase family protein n=1 Tax=Sphingorhabdus lutea TaxID=1913578 RepID=A0A1L3JDG1_9SPHN|nr:cryptochrome/photolyase family protein [Sphingorhabdus lutea]APG63162.1 cryptochrome/photolyase family protein [Sphingorhabdus lutea]